MADITATEKEGRPGSYRLDHPDFGTVCKTSFAKGVITEFKKLSDDPLTVASMVKVKVDGQEESDFIPLWYHPKKEYWDTEEFKAQDFNSEGNYFENAWMSFRVDDEVKVMLVEDKPFAVVGFLDGIPRLGEDIIKFVSEPYQDGSPHVVHWQASKQKVYKNRDEDVKGPDDKDLGLTKECELLWNGGLYYIPSNPAYPMVSGDQQNVWCIEYTNAFEPYATELWYRIIDNSRFYTEIMAVVGPIIYIFQIFWSALWTFNETAWVNGTVSGGAGEVYPNDGFDNPLYPGPPPTLDSPPAEYTGFTLEKLLGPRKYVGSGQIILRAAIYSKEQMEIIKGFGKLSTEEAFNSESMGTDYPGTFKQTKRALEAFPYDNGMLVDIDDEFWVKDEMVNYGKLKLFVKPHSKDEEE